MIDAFEDDAWEDARLVHAGGGVVVRAGRSGVPEILLVHRPKYDDWTLPKGKLADGETSGEAAALREVKEETGLRCRILRPAGSTRYVDHRGRDKITRYWEMEAGGGRFTPSEEVDRIRWLTIDAALETLSYEHDRALLRAWRASPSPRGPGSATRGSWEPKPPPAGR